MPTMGRPVSNQDQKFSQITMAPDSYKKNDKKTVGDQLNEMAGHNTTTKQFADRKSHNQLGKDDFLKLLTTQLANQDPSSPMDSKAFSSEMAQFASLEQMTNMNSKLEKLTGNSASEMKAYGATFLGKEVTTRGTTVDFKGEKAELSFSLPKAARNVVVRVLDEKGQLTAQVARENLGSGNHTITWDGIAVDGAPAAKGMYTIQVDAWDETMAEFKGQTQSKGTVVGVRFDNGETILELDGQKSIALRDVENFKMPQHNKSVGAANQNAKAANSAYSEMAAQGNN